MSDTIDDPAIRSDTAVTRPDTAVGSNPRIGTDIAAANGDTASNGETDLLAKPNTPTEANPFEAFKGLRLSQVFLTGSAQKLITSYSVRKPKRNSFFRVHPSEDYMFEAYIFTERDEGGLEKESYIVAPTFAEQLEPSVLNLFKACQLYLAIERHAEKPFVWAVGFPVPELGQKDCEAWRTAREHAEVAKTKWIRIEWKAGVYDRYETLDNLPEPVWPKTPFVEIVELAFRHRLIESTDHRIMKDLFGKI